MPQTYDLILKGGTVVNQRRPGGERDIGVKAGGTIVALGDPVARRRPARRSTAVACTSCRA